MLYAPLRHLQLKGLGTREQKAQALQALEFIGYHRLLIYMRPLQAAQKRFFPNVQFDYILKLYDFDRRLRLVFMDAIDRLEVAFRSAIINTLALKKGSSRIAGKVILDLYEKELAVLVAIGHSLDHFDSVVDAFQLPRVHWPLHPALDATPVAFQAFSKLFERRYRAFISPRRW